MRRIGCLPVANYMVGCFLDFTIYWSIEKSSVPEFVNSTIAIIGV